MEHLDVMIEDFLPRFVLFGGGIAVGVLLTDLLNPARPRLGRLIARVLAYVQGPSGD